ncbi:hypothetical protein CHS0354_040698 [Potamilus streckersoni]|uniref:Uncharacterized protein n=1 Tax=Potamilus streckersoni TaxID=2493646 RepID=A0AAE0SKY1_9BIVA|nr:hypothetical protein CHS0354_040698 [Potamilus streckersoni]
MFTYGREELQKNKSVSGREAEEEDVFPTATMVEEDTLFSGLPSERARLRVRQMGIERHQNLSIGCVNVRIFTSGLSEYFQRINDACETAIIEKTKCWHCNTPRKMHRIYWTEYSEILYLIGLEKKPDEIKDYGVGFTVKNTHKDHQPSANYTLH